MTEICGRCKITLPANTGWKDGSGDIQCDKCLGINFFGEANKPVSSKVVPTKVEPVAEKSVNEYWMLKLAKFRK